MGRPRVHDEETRATLRTAAEQLVAEGGASAFSVRAVAERAGTSTRAVYSLFGSKEGLLVDALAQDAYTFLADGMDNTVETDDPAADLIEMGVSVYRRLVLERPALYRIAFQRIVPDVRAGPELTEARERALSRLQAKVQRVADAGQLGSTSVRDGAVAFNAMCEGLANSELRGHDPEHSPSRRRGTRLARLPDSVRPRLQRERPCDVHAMTTVELREVTKGSLHAVLDLAVDPEQEQFVATNARSIAEAHFEPHAWFRAVYADDAPVGFVMAYREPPTAFWVWRFMIDAAHQGKGYGRRALELLVDEARKDGVDEVKLSYHAGEHSPEEFYTRFGFVDTGEVEEGEHVMRFVLD